MPSTKLSAMPVLTPPALESTTVAVPPDTEML